jgi:hypothetical protein
MEPSGRERRRKGPINRLRRVLYGLLLMAAAPGAAAADETAYIGKYRAASAAASLPYQRIVEATIQGLVVLRAEPAESAASPAAGIGYPRIALDNVNAHFYTAVGADPSLVKLSVTETGSIRDGVGFDLSLPDLGRFHLNLYSRRNARTEGARWRMDRTEPAERKTWSMGGSLEVVRTVDGDRQLAFVPELLVDLDPGNAGLLPFQATLKYGNWKSVSERRSLDEQAVQIMFKWRV